MLKLNFAKFAILLAVIFPVSTILLSSPTSAISLTDAESVCNQLGGLFTDNSQSAGAQNGSEDAAKCGQIPNSTDPAKKTACEDSGGTFSQNTSTCNWHSVDEVVVPPRSVSELRTLCESHENTYFADFSADYYDEQYVDCMGMPRTTCQANGGTVVLGTNTNSSTVGCRWTNITTNEESGQPTTETKYTCSNSGGAGALGWIVCPIMEWASGAAEGIYKDYVKPSLHISPQLFSAESSEATNNAHAAWSTFRDVANVVFVIFLLFIIFSQVTGIGIDNYGIKKSLPKLIIAAILVNISYFICMGAIDISNIVGNHIQEIFQSIPTGTPAAIEGVDLSGATGSTTISAVAIGVALFAAGRAIWANPAIVLTLLVSLLGLIISIFFLLVLLVAREAVVIILVVLSPLAFVCYMLPNTKQTFDKWLNTLKALLLVYPICSLLVGGGDWLSRLLLSAGYGSGGLIKAFTAMLVGILPIFFIPTVLKSSMSALGTVGAKLSGLGKVASKWSTGKIKKSEGFQNVQRRGGERRLRIKAGIDRHGDRIQMGRFRQAVFRGGRDNRARSAIAYDKMIRERGSLRATEGADFMLATDTENVARELVATGRINELGYDADAGTITGGMSQDLLDAFARDDFARIRAIQDAMTAKGEAGRDAFKAVYNQAVQNQATTGRGISARGAKIAADNLMNRHAADYKNNNRDLFNVMQRINAQDNNNQAGILQQTITTGAYLAGTNQQGVSNRARLALNATATTMGNMDDSSFEATFGGYHQQPINLGGMTQQEQESIGAQAWAALHDQNANIKAERRTYLEAIVQASGYTPETRQVEVINEVDINTVNSRNNQQNPTEVTIRRTAPPPPRPPVIYGPNGQPLPPSNPPGNNP